jgi:hypothetical protein
MSNDKLPNAKLSNGIMSSFKLLNAKLWNTHIIDLISLPKKQIVKHTYCRCYKIVRFYIEPEPTPLGCSLSNNHPIINIRTARMILLSDIVLVPSDSPPQALGSSQMPEL